MIYDICYVDDKLLPLNVPVPNETSIIPQDQLQYLLGQAEWDDFVVKSFLSQTINKTRKFKRIKLSGFTNPEFLINYLYTQPYHPKTIMLDWDFGTSTANDYIDEIILKTNVNDRIFILTGNDLEEDVISILSPRKMQSPERDFSVFSKSVYLEAKNTQEDLIEEIISEYQKTSEIVKHRDMDITFYPSHILSVPEFLWLLDSILTERFVTEFLNENAFTINQHLIEKMFEQAGIKFYVNTKHSRIYSEIGVSLRKLLNDEVREITPVYAIKNFDIFTLEEAVEKAYSTISME
jgi:hypothetical protein